MSIIKCNFSDAFQQFISKCKLEIKHNIITVDLMDYFPIFKKGYISNESFLSIFFTIYTRINLLSSNLDSLKTDDLFCDCFDETESEINHYYITYIINKHSNQFSKDVSNEIKNKILNESILLSDINRITERVTKIYDIVIDSYYADLRKILVICNVISNNIICLLLKKDKNIQLLHQINCVNIYKVEKLINDKGACPFIGYMSCSGGDDLGSFLKFTCCEMLLLYGEIKDNIKFDVGHILDHPDIKFVIFNILYDLIKLRLQ